MLRAFGRRCQQESPQALPVAADHGEGHIALAAVAALIGTAVEAMGLEGLARRCHRGLLTAPEVGVGLAAPCGGVARTLRGPHRAGYPRGAAFLMGRAVNALVHTDAAADRAARRGRCHPPGPCRWLRAGGTAAAG